jgi:arginine N-succinyltransferase
MPESKNSFIISNTLLADYRATSANLLVSDETDEVTISPEIAAALMVAQGEQIRVLTM